MPKAMSARTMKRTIMMMAMTSFSLTMIAAYSGERVASDECRPPLRSARGKIRYQEVLVAPKCSGRFVFRSSETDWFSLPR
ncbi:hypothetical protein GGR53DRAFT_484457 [Hypoxylon sp. FL1150]|nr:hypothetical protein GGR53DRAFT_484457 [Hypoxylon sp. FL1150]